jgi:hypothetical protein
MLGGLVGVGIVIAVILVLGRSGVSGEKAQEWEENIVYGLAAAGLLYFVWLRRRD